MALTRSNFNFLYTQVGYYIYPEDRVIYGTGTTPADPDEVGTGMAWCYFDSTQTPPTDDGVYEFTAQQTNLRFLGNVGQEYHIFMYQAENWLAPSINKKVYYYDNNFWRAEQDGITTNPDGNPLNWTLITASNVELLNANDAEVYKTDGYNVAIYSPANSDFEVTKTGDHAFTVDWLGEEIITDYTVYNYNIQLIESGEVVDNTHDFVFEQDGLYVVSYITEDEISHYVNVYDFTDSEKCYLELMVDILCQCIDCDDCPGKNYQRALAFSNMYLLIRDMAYADSAVNLGLISTTILRTEYISTFGLVMAKLMLMADSCLCDNSEEDKTPVR